MEHRATSLANAAAKGLLWLVGQTIVSRGLQALSQILLAWLLTPNEFGVVALAFTIVQIVSTLFGLGFDDVLLQRHNAMKLWIPTVFWLSLTVGVLGALAMIVVAPVGMFLYGQPQLAGLIVVIALATPIGALGTVPITILRSSLNFGILSVVSLGEVTATSILSVALAYAGFGPYSFVLPFPIVAAARVILLWRAAKPNFAAKRISSRWRLLMPSASAVLGSRLLATFRDQGDYIILGLTASTNEVGLYFFGFRIAVQPMRTLAHSFASVLFPALVQHRNDPLRQRDAALLVSEMLAIIVMPACFLQAALAPPFLEVLFDAKWRDAGLIIQLLTVGLSFDATSWTASTLLASRGDFHRGFLYELIVTPLFLAFVAVGAMLNGAVGTAAAVACYLVTIQPFYCYAAFNRPGGVKFRKILSLYFVPASLSGLTVTAAFLLSRTLSSSPWFQLCFTPPIALLAYAPLISICSPQAYLQLKNRVSALVKARHGAALSPP